MQQDDDSSNGQRGDISMRSQFHQARQHDAETQQIHYMGKLGTMEQRK